MIENSFAYISNYMCRESIRNLNNCLTETELKSFSNNDYYYLTTIYYLGKPNFSQVAKELGLTKPAVSALVRKLSKMGLIEKTQSEEDKRVHFIKLTDKGKKIVEGDEVLLSNISSLIKNLLKNEEQYNFVDSLLNKIVTQLENKK
ncbi:MAG: MarR family winged helix-turn-helix transcriptional regulator [Bacillota bacterium]|nr:MarR family winged helix-turn-helix transcriptional regulator [Bacillota bacterium]